MLPYITPGSHGTTSWGDTKSCSWLLYTLLETILVSHDQSGKVSVVPTLEATKKGTRNILGLGQGRGVGGRRNPFPRTQHTWDNVLNTFTLPLGEGGGADVVSNKGRFYKIVNLIVRNFEVQANPDIGIGFAWTHGFHELSFTVIKGPYMQSGSQSIVCHFLNFVQNLLIFHVCQN